MPSSVCLAPYSWDRYWRRLSPWLFRRSRRSVRHARLIRRRVLTFDWTVLVVGFAILAVGLGALTVALAFRRTARRRIGRRTEPVQRGSVVVNSAARYGLPAPAVAGLRFSLEAGHGRSAVPVRSVLVGAVLAVTVVVATVTFASGLNTLVSHPSLYGWNWNFAIDPDGGDNVPAFGRPPARPRS